MQKTDQTNPFELLGQLSTQFKETAAALPARQVVDNQWWGVGFSLHGRRYVAPFSEVAEILHVPSCTRVPGVKHWVNGLANVRGRLMSVIDLGQFFDGKSSMSSKRCRLLAIKHGDLYSGVVVDEVFGMQTFSPQQRVAAVEEPNPMVQHFVQGGFVHDEQSLPVFSLFDLVQAPSFLQVAV